MARSNNRDPDNRDDVIRHANRPGQPELNYRLGTQPEFLDAMVARLPGQEIPDGRNAGTRPLAALKTRELDDPVIALLDSWACVEDVLTFYQERIANEGFLRTATERRSVLELARSIGHELRPGISASAWLAFTVESTAGVSNVPRGTRVRSVPGQDQQPQTFETDAPLVARAAWNLLRPRPPGTEPQTIQGFDVPDSPDNALAISHGQLVLRGTATRLEPGDFLLIVGSEQRDDPDSRRWSWLVVQDVVARPQQDQTRITWRGDVSRQPPPDDDGRQVLAFRKRMDMFGHNAPRPGTLPENVREMHGIPGESPPAEWPDFALERIELDGAHPRITPGDWLMVVDSEQSDAMELFRVTRARVTNRQDFTLSGKATVFETAPALQSGLFHRRHAGVHGEGRELQLARTPIPRPDITGNTMELIATDPPLLAGQVLIIAQEGPDAAVEVATIQRVIHDEPGIMRVTLESALEGRYRPERVQIHGNAVRASHGETAVEVVGSGDATRRNQQFVLNARPLTYVPASGPRGVQSTLSVQVNDVEWTEAPVLHPLGGRDQRYVLRTDDDQRTTLTFGDGETGARLPSGRDNVIARYRRGSGEAGNVAAGALSALQSRPLGIRAVKNPQPASGGADPESLEQARRNAPSSVLTMGRLVSLRDHEDFARSFSGIGKAQARFLRGRQGQLVHITVGGVHGAEVDEHSLLYQALLRAMRELGSPSRQFQIDSYQAIRFRVEAKIRVAPGHTAERVKDAIRETLLDHFSFARRDFAQSVTVSEVISVIHGVDGVVAVDLDALRRSDGSDPMGSDELTSLPAEPARFSDSTIQPAQLLLLAARSDIELSEAF